MTTETEGDDEKGFAMMAEAMYGNEYIETSVAQLMLFTEAVKDGETSMMAYAMAIKEVE